MRLIDADALIEFCAERWIPLNIDAVNMQPTIQPEKAQLSPQGTTKDTTSDTISRQEAIEKFAMTAPQMSVIHIYEAVEILESMPTIQPVATDTNVGDKISKFIDGLEEIFADLRERHVDDSVCGLCEYEGAYMGQSGDWCNECPGFDRDDCFKLSDKTRKKWTEEIIKALPTVQSEQSACEYCHEDSDGYVKPLEKNCHASIRFGMDGWELSLRAKGWHGSAKIKYCPICGRRLTHE